MFCRIFFAVILICGSDAVFLKKYEEEGDDVLKLIRRAGYRGESYYVRPEDDLGWTLKMHRILPRNGQSGAQPVFLMHGLFAASADYVITGRKIALAYLLADNNYDVFIGNSRGNRHARLTKDANQSTVWNFSFNEIGNYDVAAMIDRALQINGRDKLFYVGHSQGTSSVLALLVNRPEYNSKIIQAHLLAPVAFTKYLPNPWLKDIIHPLMNLFEKQKVKYVNFSDIFNIGSSLSTVLCNNTVSGFTTEFCKAIIYAIVGTNTYQEEIDTRILPDLINHISWKLSAQQLVHYGQMYFSGKFRKYDYKSENMRIYGAPEPPEYDLSKVRAPMYLYRGPEDLLASKQDVEHLVKLLPNVKHYRVVPNFNHLDFTYGRRTRKVLYNDILNFIRADSSDHSNYVRY